MDHVNGRTRDQWRAYDRWHAIVAGVLAIGLLALWQSGRGPLGDAGCCGAPSATPLPPAASPSAPTPPGLPVAAAPTAEPPPGPPVAAATTVEPTPASPPAPATVITPSPVAAAPADSAPAVAAAPAAGSAADTIGAETCGRALDSDLSFRTGSSELRPAGKRQLDLLLPCLAGKRVAVTGHSDSVGDARTNLRLSQARADAVVRHLAGRGADRARMSARGVGAAKPLASNATEAGRRANRRVEIAVSP